MSDTTPRSGLPLLAAAQAQKHVTHNEALIMLDALSCARLLDRDLSTPPGSPSDGDAYLVKATGTDDWTGQDGRIAFCVDGGWRFYTPYQGLVVYIADEDEMFVYDGSAWADLASAMAFQGIPMLGVNTAADATNRLAVSSGAVLFDHAGGGTQVKLNKNASADTASFLYQDGYSGRAEIGLCGDDNFHFKVSADGSSWTDAAMIDKATGALALGGPSLTLAYPGGSAAQLRVQAEATANNQIETYNTGAATAPTFTMRRGRGTIAAPAVAQTNDTVGYLSWQPYTGAGGSGFTNGARIQGVMTETAAVDGTHAGMQLRFLACPNGSGTLSEIMRLDAASGLSMFGANPVIDQNRAVRLRSTTIAGAVAPSAAGGLFHHSDAQGGAGEVAVDTGAAYRHAGQAAVKRLASDADAAYTPRADGRIVRDLAALTADRKLVLATTNVTDGHKVEVTRRGSSGGFSRKVCQADGTTLIAALADNASADFVYDAAAGAWFQK